METAFYDETSLLSSSSKNSKAFDGSSLWLNLCSDSKLLDVGAARRDDLAFSDLADFLRSPDLGISSPDLESLVWKEWNDTEKTASPTALPETLIKQEENTIENITKEQEVFAFGFTEALKKLKEEEKQECQEIESETPADENSDDSSDSCEEESVPGSEDSNSKLTFISYAFNSADRLPSFEEAFAKIIFNSAKNQELHRQLKREIKSEEGEFEVPRKVDNISRVSANSSSLDCVIDTEQTFYWDKVETVDEGYCGRGNTIRNYTDNSLAPGNTRQEKDLFTRATNARTIDRSSTRDLSNIIPKDFEDDDFIGENHIIDENLAHKQWLNMHSKLYVNTSLQDSRLMVSRDTHNAMPVDVATNDHYKPERRTNFNRFSPLRRKKVENVDGKEKNKAKPIGGICLENAKLIEELEIIRKKKECLAVPLIDATSGCPDV